MRNKWLAKSWKRIKQIFLFLVILILSVKIYLETGNYMFESTLNTTLLNSIEPSDLVKHKSIESDNFSFHYFISGKENAPLVILLHPAFSDHTIFHQQIDTLGTAFRVVTVDLIGHGLSQSKSKWTIDHSVKYIEQIITSEGYDNAHLVGVSVGSLIAQYFAYLYPEKILTLTAVGGYYIHENNEEVQHVQNQSKFGAIIRAIFSMKAFRRYAANISTNSGTGKQLFYTSSQYFTRRSFPKMEGLSAVVKERDIAYPKYPHLIIIGDNDLDLARKMSMDWHNHLPNSLFFEVENSGHCVNLDQPIEFNCLLIDFLTGYHQN